jgi:hypothetical protein
MFRDFLTAEQTSKIFSALGEPATVNGIETTIIFDSRHGEESAGGFNVVIKSPTARINLNEVGAIKKGDALTVLGRNYRVKKTRVRDERDDAFVELERA